MAYNSADRSERILQNKRFTTNQIGAPAEAFTKVLDLGVGEIYLDTQYIPTGSSQLFFSGSSGANLIVSASVVDPAISNNLPILKYWYRQKLWPGKSAGLQVYYFRQSQPSSLSDTVFSDSIIESDQVPNFISPKYIIPSQAGRVTENTLPNLTGYKVTIYKSTSATAGGITEAAVTDDKFSFDYKTGVLSWLSGQEPTALQYVYMTAYQYVGRTIQDQLTGGYTGSFTGTFNGIGSGSFSGSFQGNSTGVFTGIGSGSFSGSLQGAATLNNLTLTGSFNHTGSYNLIGNITQTGSFNQSGSINVVGAIISNGINVVDNAIAMAIALG
jgi:hypothetical protein